MGVRLGGAVAANKGGLTYEFTDHVDASFGDDYDTRRSTGGYIFFFNGAPITWRSGPQTIGQLPAVLLYEDN